MIVYSQQLKEKYINFSDIKGKIAREIKKNRLFPLVKGIYETNGNVDGYKLAQVIYGPSYLSFDYALYYYGIIPEAVYNTFTCATINKRKIKIYNNKFGTYTYRDVPANVYHFGISLYSDGQYTYHLAEPEKALCDKLYIMPPVRSIKELKRMLFEDLRIDEELFYNLNKEDICLIAPLYHSNNLNMLLKLIKEGK
ncbi:MAG: hypothetical protein ACI311_04430 [Bacilli bacterium]